jgi:hypothetical protein
MPESANRAIYHPIVIVTTYVARRVWWVNGESATGGATIEVGIYRDAGGAPGVKVISGSAVQSSATTVQFVNVTDTALTPDRYWLAIMASSGTDTTLFRSASSIIVDAAMRYQQDSANPLPGTATPVESTANGIYLFGFATTASP